MVQALVLSQMDYGKASSKDVANSNKLSTVTPELCCKTDDWNSEMRPQNSSSLPVSLTSYVIQIIVQDHILHTEITFLLSVSALLI